MARAELAVHKIQIKTATPDVPPELLTQAPPTYVLPTFLAPCKPAVPSSLEKSYVSYGLIKVATHLLLIASYQGSTAQDAYRAAGDSHCNNVQVFQILRDTKLCCSNMLHTTADS